MIHPVDRVGSCRMSTSGMLFLTNEWGFTCLGNDGEDLEVCL